VEVLEGEVERSEEGGGEKIKDNRCET